jgi:CDP-ribitol ribitolphosphotransferase
MGRNTAAFQIRQLLKQAVQNFVLPVCYELNRWRKIRPELIVFADAHHDSRPAAMELLVCAARKEGSFDVAENYRDYVRCGELKALLHSMAFMKLYAQAGTVVICDNFLPAASCRKKAGTKVVQLWHACGCYKKFGYDAQDDIPEGYHGNVFRNTDLVTVSGKAAVKPFCSAMRLTEKQVKAAGVSRTDLYFDKNWRERCREAFFRNYPQAEGKKIVLWAPTFRGNAHAPSLEMTDPELLQKELGEDYFVITRLHPHLLRQLEMEKDWTGPLSGNDRYSCPIPTEELYPVTDLLIADYSSLIYEYLLFGKGLVLYVPDLEEYEKHRGFYMDIREIPGEIVTEKEALAGAVRAAAESSPAPAENGFAPAGGSFAAEYADFLKPYMGACDGHATERILRWILRSKGFSAAFKGPSAASGRSSAAAGGGRDAAGGI